MADIVEDRVVSEEYKLWKKNCPFMYDFMMTRILKYPSPIIQWFPEVKKVDDDPRDSVLQSLLLATNTGSQEDCGLLVASVLLPGYKEPVQKDLYSMPEDYFGSFFFYSDYFEPDFQLNHEGMVTCARYMPEKSNIIASKSNTDLFIFDIKSSLNDFRTAEKVEPTYQYYNLNSVADLEWKPTGEGILMTTFESSKIAIWDIGSQKKRKSLTPKIKLDYVPESTEDSLINNASWHQKHPTIVGAISAKGEIMLWDIRSRNLDQPSSHFIGHNGSGFQIKFNHLSENVFITSGSDKQITLWDLRNLKIKLHSIMLKEENFQSLKWSPHCDSLFAATTNDRKVYLFDINRILDDTLLENDDIPPSLLFVHGGHTSKISDFDWNPSEENSLMLSSVSDDNVIQIWQMTSKYFIGESNKIQ